MLLAFLVKCCLNGCPDFAKPYLLGNIFNGGDDFLALKGILGVMYKCEQLFHLINHVWALLIGPKLRCKVNLVTLLPHKTKINSHLILLWHFFDNFLGPLEFRLQRLDLDVGFGHPPFLLQHLPFAGIERLIRNNYPIN